jgi:hypothetical protein
MPRRLFRASTTMDPGSGVGTTTSLGTKAMITVQTIALADEGTAIQIRGRRIAAAVLLIQAVGGGWNAAELPSVREVTAGSRDGSEPMTRALHGLAGTSTMEAGPFPSGRTTNCRAWKLCNVLRWPTLNTVVIASCSRISW